MMKISLKTIGLKLRTSLLYRLLVYALVTAIIEGTAYIVLYSLGYPNNVSASTSIAWLIFYNIYIWLALGDRPQPPGTSSPDSLMHHPLFPLFVGVVGMFVMVTLMGETIVWLRQEISKLSREISNWRRSGISGAEREQKGVEMEAKSRMEKRKSLVERHR